MTARPSDFGWTRDLPDHRDYPLSTPKVRKWLSGLGYKRGRRAGVSSADCRDDFRAPESVPGGFDAAAATVSLVGYFERRSTGRDRDGSVAFIHQAASLLEGSTSRPVGPRAALRAAVRCGVLPSHLWDSSSPALTLSLAALTGSSHRMSKAIYVRLDTPWVSPKHLVRRIKVFLSGGFPCLLGFAVPGSIDGGPDLIVPRRSETIVGGRCAVAVGFDDQRCMCSSKGALLIQPGWGSSWGEGGYGWLPYEFLSLGLAGDIWTLLNPRWLKSGDFGWSGQTK